MANTVPCPVCGHAVARDAKACPSCGKPKPGSMSALALLGWGVVLVFVVGICSGLQNSSHPAASLANSDAAGASPAVTPAPQLELQRFTWREEYGYAILEGSVKNISSASLRNVSAVGSFYDASGALITSDDALIEYNPILPGQTSPFKVMTRYNPEMKKAGVDFKELLGTTIEWRERSPKSTTQ